MMNPTSRITISAAMGLAMFTATAGAQDSALRSSITVQQAEKIETPQFSIRNVTVRPGTNTATITFGARAGLAPVVHIATNAPVQDSLKRWNLPGNVVTLRARAGSEAGTYVVEATGLQPGTRYHYVISVPGTDPTRPLQVTGEFTTQRLVADVATGQKLTETAAYHIRDIKIEPAPYRVAFAFKGPVQVVPMLEIGRAAPRKNFDTPERLEFRREDVIGGFPVGGNKTNGNYRIEVGATTELDQATQYHYMISVPSKDIRRPYQVTGTFKTLSQKVRVVFNKIFINNDSDGGGAGELYFNFWVNDVYRLLNGGKVHAWKTGETHSIDMVFELDRAPDNLRLQVDGEDDDSDIGTDITNIGAAFHRDPSDPLEGPGKNEKWEWNVMKAAYDLSRRPGMNPRPIDFVHGSMPNGGKLGRLSFTVYGEVHIFRE